MTRLLIVEDNEMNCDMLSRRLKKKGFEIDIAIDGQEGIDKAQELLPDLILMDMSLPIKDGWTATKELRSIASTSDIKIIALTAHAMSGDKEQAMEAGCNDYDTKPVDMKRLLEKINNLLEQ